MQLLFHLVYYHSTCFGHGSCPSSGVIHKTVDAATSVCQCVWGEVVLTLVVCVRWIRVGCPWGWCCVLIQRTHTTPHALTRTGGCIYSFIYCSWRWTRTVSETCRVIINQVKQKLHLVGYLLIRNLKMHGTMNVKYASVSSKLQNKERMHTVYQIARIHIP